MPLAIFHLKVVNAALKTFEYLKMQQPRVWQA